ncbi:MAG: hypothetical protein ACYC9L_02825, partial [Sulfuricaulis sp.]
MAQKTTILQYLADEIADKGWLSSRTGRPMFERIMRELLSHAFYRMPYNIFSSRPNLDTKALPKTPAHAGEACDKLDVERPHFDAALEKAQASLRFGLQSGAIARVDAGRVEI